jgi:Mg/Co/Ni transporter MgtE
VSGPALFAHPDEELSVVARGMQHSARSGTVVVDDMNTILGVVTWEELARAVALRAGADSVPSVASASPSEHARADERG